MRQLEHIKPTGDQRPSKFSRYGVVTELTSSSRARFRCPHGRHSSAIPNTRATAAIYDYVLCLNHHSTFHSVTISDRIQILFHLFVFDPDLNFGQPSISDRSYICTVACAVQLRLPCRIQFAFIRKTVNFKRARHSFKSPAFMLSSCSSLPYALRVTGSGSRGLRDHSLRDTFHTVVGKLVYCALAWYGFCSATDRLQEADISLYRKVLSCQHLLLQKLLDYIITLHYNYLEWPNEQDC